ncbi:hypothetical protein [Streptomyces sp. Agncl-13]|uniref:hypothetical protein n=1 Tax=Streptomyces sp. Agncl-13 TaxID=3400628 RepID=UPI003A8609DF
MTSPSIGIPPNPGFIATVTAATGIHRRGNKAMPQLLITHPGPRYRNETHETVMEGMRQLSTALGLGIGNQDPPVIGRKLVIERTVAALDYGHDQYVMSFPLPSQDWLTLVAVGAGCRVYLTFTPLAIGATRAEADTHLRDSLARGQLMWGTAFIRRRF